VAGRYREIEGEPSGRKIRPFAFLRLPIGIVGNSRMPFKNFLLLIGIASFFIPSIPVLKYNVQGVWVRIISLAYVGETLHVSEDFKTVLARNGTTDEAI
jgi:hypothetical protein